MEIIKRPNRVKDQTGKVYGRLTAIRMGEPSPSGRIRWVCKCECGNEVIVQSSSLGRGTLSCGCLQKERTADSARTHGMTGTKEFMAWVDMRRRCYNPKYKFFARYGGRGIIVCERWKESFENFFADMGLCPPDKYAVGRIDNNGNYEPSNCRWENRDEEMNNTSRNRYFEYEGRIQTGTQWARELGLDPAKIYAGLWLGKSIKEMFGLDLTEVKSRLG